MPTLAEAETILRTQFHLSKFRPNQFPIIQAALTGRDVFAILPTGGGKSVCFQIPGLLSQQLTIVISPLIALMVDQVTGLKRKKFSAECWHSQLDQNQEQHLLAQLTNQNLKFLYLSPEKLLSSKVQRLLKSQTIGLLVIDEAHCISLWGHDFRPSYLKISGWLETLSPRPQVMALTATATPTVQVEIKKYLNLIQPLVITNEGQRSNLQLQVLNRNSPTKKLISILTLIQNQPQETILIYCATRSEVELLTRILRRLQFRLQFHRPILGYHGGQTKQLRQSLQIQFTETSAVIMIATNAFGMGIDKPNIRLIIHAQLPSNLENYAQEIGRAGRDNLSATTVLLVSEFDWKIQLQLAAHQPYHDFKMTWLRQFILSSQCRSQTLAEYFGQKILVCGQCDNCRQKLKLTAHPISQPNPKTFALYQQLKKLKIPYLPTLKLVALTQPHSITELSQIPGVGSGWLKKWSGAVLALTQAHQVNRLL
ncbi:MAG TPA: hypothetical protein DEP87_01040 [Candidatus Pacebacteria bacterium]|nr:hypothetical protein [Candidatus Paceibacterota bacterium]